MGEEKEFTETKSDKFAGVMEGGCTGWAVGSVLITLGVIVSLTGVGLFVGLPLIFVGILVLFIGPIAGLGSLRGPCPYCGTEVRTTGRPPGVTCKACKKRIVIRDRKFIKVD